MSRWVSSQKIESFLLHNFSQAYLLSNEGYDVWLGNVRGSKYSMKHRRLDPLSREFWQFSFHEIGYFDLPAMINYILAATQKPSLFYVGHNQGTTVLLVMLTTRPEFNQKILNAQLMAPIAFMNYLHPVLSLGGDDTLRASQLLNNYNFASLITFTNAIIDTYCTDRNTNSLNFCLNLWSFAFGRNLNQAEFDPKLLLKIPDHISPTASTRQWDHYLQLAQTGKFRQFDIRGNSVGSASPAEYNLLNVKAPLYFYHAAEDLIVSRLVGLWKSSQVREITFFLFTGCRTSKNIRNSIGAWISNHPQLESLRFLAERECKAGFV